MVGDITDRVTRPVWQAEGDALPGAFSRWAGWAGLIGTLAFVVTIIMTFGGVAAPDGPGDMSRYLDEISGNGAGEYVYGVAGVVLSFLYIPLAVAMYRVLGDRIGAWYGSAAVVIGLVVLFPAYLINLLAPFVLVPLGVELGGAGLEALYADYALARAAAELLFTVGSVLSLGFGPLLWGAAWLRSSVPGRWLAWTAVLTGVTGMIWFVWLVDNGVYGMVLILNVVLSLVLFTGIAVVLILRGRAIRRAS